MLALKLRLVLAACCAALVFPASAAAIHCAPPGVAGVDQYFEQIPASACNGSATGPGSGGGHHGSLPAGTAAQLSKQGAVGQAISNLVSSTGQGSGSHSGSSAAGGTGTQHSKSSSHTAAGTGAGAGQSVSSNGQNPVSGILHPVLTGSSSGGIGVLLPIIIIATLVLVLVTTVVRRRFRTSGPGT